MSGPRRIDVVGRFPPPLDGQAIATDRLASLLASPLGGAHDVGRCEAGVPDSERLVLGPLGRLRRSVHYAGLGGTVRRALADAPGVPVLWSSVSPTRGGHLRDRVLVVPAFGRRTVVGVVHSGNFDTLFQGATAGSGRALVRRLRALVFLSEGLAERCAPWVPAAKRWVVPNTVDLGTVPTFDTVDAARRRRAARPGLRLLFVSGMIPSKGYDDVLSALALLRSQGLDATARFVGRWPTGGGEASFRARTAGLGLTDAVETLGGVGRAEVRPLLLDADALVLPTTYPTEAQPLVVIEALACGTPVIVTRHAGLPEMIDDGAEGTFVDAGAPRQIAEAARALTSGERWLAASTAARDRFERQFSPEIVGQHWQEVLSRL